MKVIRNQQIVGNGLYFQGIQSGGTVSGLIGMSASNKVAIDPNEIGVMVGGSTVSGRMVQWGTSTDAAAGEHWLTRLHNANGDGTFNEVMNFGYNLDYAGGRVESTDSALGFSLEGRWMSGGVPYTEAHLLFVDTDGIQYRPWSWRIRKGNRAAQDWQQMIHADVTTFYAPQNPNIGSYCNIGKSNVDVSPLDASGVSIGQGMRFTADAFNSQISNLGTSGAELQFAPGPAQPWNSIRVLATNGLQVGTGILSSPVVMIKSGTATGFQMIEFYNNGGIARLGINDSAGTALGATTAYATILEAPADLYFRANAATRMLIINGVQVGAPTGGDQGAGNINVAGDIWKNATVYTNPDFVFEHYYTGTIEQFRENEGAEGYPGLMPLDHLEQFTREHLHLPRVHQAGGIFKRGDVALEKIEEAHLYILELHRRLTILEGMAA